MSSSLQRKAPISEPLPCPECEGMAMRRVLEDCTLLDGLKVKKLAHHKCSLCGARFFDDEAMHRIQETRMAVSLAGP